ncbi:MAG: GNAT family N-acetyltransferase [Desulfuromonadales bacterium]|nr:GNAT family N-acetyltransferase [Desulfuromonadales bacterium]
MAGKYQVEILGEEYYEAWDRFVDISPQGCIFCKSWWLDAVAPGGYSIMVAYRNGSLVGGIPLIQKRGRFARGYGMPPLTQTLGILLRPFDLAYTERISEEKRIIECLVDALGNLDFFGQNFHYNFQNWMPFMWRGYRQTTRYTYVLENIKDTEQLWRGLAKNIRSDINKAYRLGLSLVEERSAPDVFWETYKSTFSRQNMEAPVQFPFFSRFDDKLGKLDKRRMFLVIDPQRRVHAGIYLVFDNNYAYYLMGGGNPELRNSGASAFGLFEGMKAVSSVADSFDFEGSVVKNIETFFRAFGGRQKPYFQISRQKTTGQKIRAGVKTLLGR